MFSSSFLVSYIYYHYIPTNIRSIHLWMVALYLICMHRVVIITRWMRDCYQTHIRILLHLIYQLSTAMQQTTSPLSPCNNTTAISHKFQSNWHPIMETWSQFVHRSITRADNAQRTTCARNRSAKQLRETESGNFWFYQNLQQHCSFPHNLTTHLTNHDVIHCSMIQPLIILSSRPIIRTRKKCNWRLLMIRMLTGGSDRDTSLCLLLYFKLDCNRPKTLNPSQWHDSQTERTCTKSINPSNSHQLII